MDYTNFKITIKKAEEIVLDLYGLQGIASKLPGEIDFNFRIKVENNEGYILKISRPDENQNYLDFQQKLLKYIENNGQKIIAPKVIEDLQGNIISEIIDSFGASRSVRLLTWIPGRIWDEVNPQLDGLRFSLGEQCGLLTKSLQGFDHPEAHRDFVWDIAQSLWTKEHLHLFEGEEKDIVSYFQENFESVQKDYSKLRKSTVHNDANNHNVIVSSDLISPQVEAAIDYGDAIYTQVINDVAIAGAYVIMGHVDPLDAFLTFLKGYHSKFPLKEEELKCLYPAIAMRLITTVTRSAINKIKEPENQYLLISEKPAWSVLKKWIHVNDDFAHFSFREACRFKANPLENEYLNWSTENAFELTELFPSLGYKKIHALDLSVSSPWLGHHMDFEDKSLFSYKINKLQNQHPDKILAGGYLEPRPFYNNADYSGIGNFGKKSRTIHLGMDFWVPRKTPVHNLLEGEIVISKKHGSRSLVILKHHTDEFEFFTLYDNLSDENQSKNRINSVVKKGDCLGFVENSHESPNNASHLHFQLLLSLLDYNKDFPQVIYHDQIEVWKSICPDPKSLFKLMLPSVQDAVSNESLISYRKKHLGKSLSLQYKVPVKMVRGSGPYLIDQYGRKYLDTVNNVAHVGHEHPSVVKAGQDQMALINTNSRYLHENINTLAQELIETLPKELNVLHFVNSGSEANELAIRMVKAVTEEKDIIASEVGYHGNSNMCIDISSYKFDGKGGSGAPEYTHVFPLPDAYRGKYQGDDTGEKYAEEIQNQIDIIQKKGRNVGALIMEPIISCGGQIDLPKGFLAKSYELVRKAGGLCISDEVQVGCGRLGKVFWGFQLHGVLPDIVTIGKPLGNGHPLAAVACTRDVADKFANGMEYFNTFGGNPVSCAIGAQVLKTIKEEMLQKNAFEIGSYLKNEIIKLSQKFSIIGDVRGEGLFLGFELVNSKKEPLPKQTEYITLRMKSFGVLMSSDGPDHNVIKIKPPLVFTKENAEELIFYLTKIFSEDFMNTYN